MKKLLGLLILPLLILPLLLTECGFEIVDTGFRGVQTRFGKVEGGTLDEGIHFYNPFTSNVTEMDVRIQKLEKATTAYSKDAQIVLVTYAVNFYPDKTKMHILYQEVGKDWQDKLLGQILEGAVKEVAGKFIAVDLISNRNEAVKEIKDLLITRLADKSITMTNFEISNLDFNDSFEQAVERKVIAIQQAEEAKNKTVRVKEEANQKVIAAKAEAESMRIRAQALSQNKNLVEYEAVQKWDGKLPQYSLGGSLPLINLGSLGK